MTEEQATELAEHSRLFGERLADLCNSAERVGIELRITRVPLHPLAMSNTLMTCEAWPTNARWQVVQGSNFDDENYAECFMSEGGWDHFSKIEANRIKRKLNLELQRKAGENSPIWYKLVRKGYVLNPGFQP